MATGLMLDTLNPPSPDALLRDMMSVRADAVGIYVLRRDGFGNLMNTGTWTLEHVARVQAAGKRLLPIMVPGNNPQSLDASIAALHATALGITTRIMVIDIEQFSFPPAQWVREAIGSLHVHGYKVLRYGDVAGLRSYPAADGDWISHGLIPVRAGSWLPVPLLPDGCVADQYAVQVTINGTGYDVSVAEMDMFSVAPRRAELDTYVREQMPLTITRHDGTIDTCSVMPDGSLRHTVLEAGTKRPMYNDTLPGSWSSLIDMHWDDAEAHLTVTGYGWQNGQGGSVWYVEWDADNPVWTGPTEVLA